MFNTHISMLQAATLMSALLLFGINPKPLSSSQVTYGTLDNFDVINDTGGECHGFEIELEGISSTDVAYTFGAPYQRYGEPTIVPTSTGVIIRYAAGYDSLNHTWSATTPIATPPYLPTQGHSCWTGGVSDPAIYYASGCDHFGASLNANPTKTTYRWLVENAAAPGTLTPFGSNASLPAPVWNVTPPAVPGAQPVAAAVISPPEVDPASPFDFGEALWVKVYTTELPDGVHAEDLDHMVIDDPNVDIVPNEPAEVEWEWILLQSEKGVAHDQVFGDGAEVGAGNDAVSRRFEFYKYTGAYDPETHEATCDNPTEIGQQTPDRCGSPDANGVAGVGDMIGAQNVAVNLLGPVVVIPENHAPVAVNDSGATNEDVPLMIPFATLLSNDGDRDLDPLTIESFQGASGGTAVAGIDAVSFTPDADFNGAASFTYTISDGQGGSSTATVNISVAAVNDPPLASISGGPTRTVLWHNVISVVGTNGDIDGPSELATWTLVSTPLKSKAVLSGTGLNRSFKADKEGDYIIRLVINDGVVDSEPAQVTITAVKKN